MKNQFFAFIMHSGGLAEVSGYKLWQLEWPASVVRAASFCLEATPSIVTVGQGLGREGLAGPP